MNELAGQTLGGYYLEAEIGRGSMGVVYRGKQIALGREVAIKVLPQSLARDASYVARFTREATIIAGLNHPNIVQIYDAGQQHTLLYFVMEFVEGPTLANLLYLDGIIPPYLAVEYAAQIAEALDAAYKERHVIHRDIKPENLMLNRWGKIKVMDFGLARASGLRAITVAKTLVGSIYYASPEQVTGEVLDNRSDIYALGVVLYEMVSGQRPFEARTMTELSQKILLGSPFPPSSLNTDITLPLEHIIMTALAVDREQRFAEAHLLAEALRGLHLQAPTITPPPTPSLATNDAESMRQREHTLRQPPKRPQVQRPNYQEMAGNKIETVSPSEKLPATPQAPAQQLSPVTQPTQTQEAVLYDLDAIATRPTRPLSHNPAPDPWSQAPETTREYHDEEDTDKQATAQKNLPRKKYWGSLQRWFKTPNE